MENTLWTLELNHSAMIVRLCCTGAMRRRLMDLGFTEGETVCKLLENRGMAAYLIRGTLIALRRCDADSILIS